MCRVHRFTRPSFIEGWSFGIGIMATDTGGHLGVCYGQGESPSFLHLAFHFSLKREPVNDKYGWIACNGFSPDEAEDFASWIAEVWQQNGNKIPYGINYWPGAHYTSDGKFIPSEETGGLTCATFVISLFDGYSMPLIDASTWKAREDDRDFQEWIVEALNCPSLAKKDPNYKNHAEQQKQHIGKAVRFRPYEVTYAVSIWNHSLVTFEDAEIGGQRLEKELRKLQL